MSDAIRSIHSPERLREHAIASLIPFFADDANSNATSARLAAQGLLDEYKAATPKELQLSTQIIALGWASLGCLSAAATVKNLSVTLMLDLQDDAIALDRSCYKATKALDARRKERTKHPRAMTLANTKWDEGVFQLAINQALDKRNDANAQVAACLARPAPVAAALAEVVAAPRHPRRSHLAR